MRNALILKVKKLYNCNTMKFIPGFHNPVSISNGVARIYTIFKGRSCTIILEEADFYKTLQYGSIMWVKSGQKIYPVIESDTGKVTQLTKILYGAGNFYTFNENPLDLRRENVERKAPEPKIVVADTHYKSSWDLSPTGSSWVLISQCINDNPQQSLYDLIKLVAETKSITIAESEEVLTELWAKGKLLRVNPLTRSWERWIPSKL